MLLKSVLSSTPLYYLSFFKAPRKVLKILIRIQRSFLWGGGRGICWVSWIKVCLPKVLGGLGVKHLDVFNLSLLGKWRWRILVDSGAVWSPLLRSRYDIPNLEDRSSRNSSQWWRDLCALYNDKSSPTNWFSKSVGREVGDGVKTKSWQQAWFGDTPLKIVFPRLHSLACDKHCYIAELGRWDGDVWRWCWQWRRNFFQWE